jgi:hypothetical protein
MSKKNIREGALSIKKPGNTTGIYIAYAFIKEEI